MTGLDVTESHANRVEARRRIGYRPQEVVYPRGMTAASFLDYIAVLKEWKDSAARAARYAACWTSSTSATEGR